MPRWKALPDELDPQIKEFTSQLRRLVDRSGMSIATVADRTGYSKSSWERYLNGRLLPPRGATQALAEVTGTEVRHLGTMWELAERAWSRSEMRHDVTMEAIQVAQARAALGVDEDESAKGRKRRRGKGAAPSAATPGTAAPAPASPSAGSSPSHAPSQEKSTPDDGTQVLRRTAPAPSDRTAQLRSQLGGTPTVARPGQQRVDVSAWGAKQDAQAPATAAPPVGAPAAMSATTVQPSAASPAAAGQGAPPGSGGGGDGGRSPKSPGRRRTTMFLAGLVGALVVIAGAVLFLDLGGGDDASAKPSPSPTQKHRDLPAGVKCSGSDCSGKDPEAMGCGGQHAATSSSGWVGPSFVEVRYSKVCKASWARITSATTDDALRITGPDGQSERDAVGTTNDAYTPMVAVRGPDDARACATLKAGGKGCTVPGRIAR